MNKPQKSAIILFHSKDIGVKSGKQYLTVKDKAGIEHSISEKRQTLWGLFDQAENGEPFLLIYDTYNNIQYISDVRPIKDDLLKLAITDMGLKMADAQTEERNRSTALSYAKDLVIGGVVDIKDIYDRADRNYRFIKGLKDNEENAPEA